MRRGRKIATYARPIREFLSGAALALTGVAVIELFLAAGMRLYSPVGWPGFGMIAGAAFFGLRGFIGGAVVVFAAYLLNRLRPERFASFYDGPGPSIAWLVAIVVLSAIAAVLSARLRRVERESALERGLRESEVRLRAITDNIPGLVAYINAAERYEFANAAYESWIGLRPEQMHGRTVREVWGEELYVLFKPNVERALRGESASYEYTISHGGRERRMLAKYAPDRDETGRVKGFFVLSGDVTELVHARNEAREARERMAQVLQSVASTDALTGLANRTALAEHIALAAARARRNGTSFALLYLDIDRFKLVNDNLGHSAGDQLLVQFAQRLRGCVRASDSVARLGGDEFVVLLDDLKERAAASRIAEKILQETRAPVALDGREMSVTTSIGIACYVADESGESVLQRADGALYRAKRAGRDTYCLV